MNKNATKLDFTWFEYPVERFEEVVGAYMEFWEGFKERHGGWEPTGTTKTVVYAVRCFARVPTHAFQRHNDAGAATYFVQRIKDKPHGWFSQQGRGFDHPGLSFTLDPVHNDPNDPTWELFLKESVIFALAHGGRVSLTQTRFITREDYFNAPGNAPLVDAPNHRFTSAFFEQCLEEGTGASSEGGGQEEEREEEEEQAAVPQKKVDADEQSAHV